MIKHYEGELGEFDYDDEEFILVDSVSNPYLHYCGKGLTVDLPVGCKSTRSMFNGCVLPEGFTLGDGFDTSNVTDMGDMFFDCKLPESFSLGNHFDTSNVIDMSFMFTFCELPESFSLGNHFDTSNVKTMNNMFCSCKLPEDFSLGGNFDTSSVTDMGCMFCGSKLPKGFSFGDKFNTKSITCEIDMYNMFVECQLPEGRTTEEFGNKPKEIINWLKSRKSNSKLVTTSKLTEESGKMLEEQVVNACKYIEDYFINGGIPLGHNSINHMRACGYGDSIIRQAMINTIEKLIQETAVSSKDMQLF